MNCFLLYYAQILGVFCNHINLPLLRSGIQASFITAFLLPASIITAFFSLATEPDQMSGFMNSPYA